MEFLISKAVELGIRLAIMPELWPSSAHNPDLILNYDHSAWARHLKDVQEICNTHSMYIHSGSAAVYHNGFRNRSYFTNPLGEIHLYDKRRIFGFGKGESAIISPGSDDLIVDFDGSSMALFTCYELRFPELFRSSLAKGMELALVSAAWPKARLGHWSALLRARAIENQAFVIGCNAVGKQGSIELGGSSEIYDPQGEPVSLEQVFPSMFIGQIDIEYLRSVRSEFPVLGDI